MHKYFQRQVHPVPRLSILREDLCKILGPRENKNSRYFSRETLGDEHLLLIRDSLSQAPSFTKRHMDDLTSLDTLDIHHVMAMDGSFLFWVDYSFREEQNPGHTGCSIYIAGRIPTEAANTNFTEPHFIMTGYSRITNGMDVFLPHEMLCRLEFPDDPSRTFLGAAYDPEAVMAGTCYAEQAFQDISAGSPLDIKRNQSWIEEPNRAKATDRYQKLLNCTFEERQMELAQRKPLTPTAGPTAALPYARHLN